ncbi:MAG TPA: UDP-N-acetylmuramoyl-tripeptide--D-alanyl-D-alanine ligase [Paludibacteraceae bacterium]|nr:UDP-N-acetylmuramoyl-tripeptide--D-alanyl-D-alanine ligase [Paludibacteraceae bacterium]HOH55304.1 UDP-N-acetylmuramoyl-tripeptide--D-alanyl-D-alanine ligase [Paludibacteraceae bacterium]
MRSMQLYNIFLQHPIITTDSRNCPANSIFFALKGENFNANTFALSALEKGCAFAVVDDKEFAVDDRFILVDNVLETLQQLAHFHRKQTNIPVLGITGTNGKTTTKELITAVLKEKFKVLSTQGNLNNHIGVPLTLLQLLPEHQLAIIEMGANHPGEIDQLCQIAAPDYGLITNVGKAHMEGFGSFEGVMRTKGELYNYVFRHGKNIFIDKNNNFLREMAANAGFSTNERIVEYGLNVPGREPAAISGEILENSVFLKMKCHTPEGSFMIETRLIGSYNAENILAAVAVGFFFGVENSAIQRGIENYNPQNNRSQLTVTQKNKLIVDAYNANPSSMSAAIQNFAQMEGEPKALIIGDMLELGEQSEEEHRNIIRLLQQKGFKNVLLVGPQFQKVNDSYLSFQNVEELIKYLESSPLEGQNILLKGSRGIHLEKVLPFL